MHDETDTTKTSDESSPPIDAATPATDAVPSEPPAASPSPMRSTPRGSGVMSVRDRRADDIAPQREVVEAAASTARTTGHRFDLMRYLRLRRGNASP